MTVNLDRYRVVNPDWMIPRDGIALEHVNDEGKLCLVACSSLPRTLVEMMGAAERHELACKFKKEQHE